MTVTSMRDQGLEHGLGLGIESPAPEVAADPALQVARLADVQDLAGRVEHPVDARPARQRADELVGDRNQRSWPVDLPAQRALRERMQTRRGTCPR